VPKVSPAHLEAQRRHILRAAAACFAVKGVQHTTVQDICAESGLSPGAIYRYFQGKDEILQAVFADDRAAQAERNRSLAEAPDPLAAVRYMARAMFSFVDDPSLAPNHRMSLQVHAEAMGDPALAQQYTVLHRETAAEVAAILRQGQAEGRVDPSADPDYTAWVLVTLYQGFRVHKLLDPAIDTARYAEAAGRLIDNLFLDGAG
jgi:AcrR family transcriptional regulator